MYTRKTIAEISLGALASNFSAIKSLLKPQTKFLASIKANAYGHGVVPLAQELVRLGVDAFGVSCVYEVIELRKAGIKLPILNMGPTFADEASAVGEYDYIPTVFSLDIAQKISAAANKKIKIHIKVDSGMNRIGAACEDVLQLVRDIQKLPNIEIDGLFTHFADADTPSSGVTEIQLQKFNNLLQELREAQIKIPLIHAANSAGALFWPESHFDMVRVGKSLYGYSPSDDENLKLPVKLEPVMSIKSYISHVKKVPADTPISYGWTFRSKKESTIITLPIGYADGFRRAPQNFGEVLIGGEKCFVVGRVCMDQSMVDASPVQAPQVGDEVVIIGRQGDEKITARDVAKQIGTSAYEVLSGVAPRVVRVYKDS